MFAKERGLEGISGCRKELAINIGRDAIQKKRIPLRWKQEIANEGGQTSRKSTMIAVQILLNYFKISFFSSCRHFRRTHTDCGGDERSEISNNPHISSQITFEGHKYTSDRSNESLMINIG